MATSDSGLLAYDAGGGLGGVTAKALPATTVTTVSRPWASVSTWRGMSSSQSIVKCGSAILSAAGRFSQIWKSSIGFGPSASTRGNISACMMPPPAVNHWTSPRPYRAAAPMLSLWSTRPLRTNVTVSKPRCGWAGKPGTRLPWYIRQPSFGVKSAPMSRPSSSRTSGASVPSPAGKASSWCTQKRKGSMVGH